MAEKKYLTIKEAADYLGVTPLTLRNWDKGGKFLAGRHPISNYRIYRLSDLDVLLSEIDNGDTNRLKLKRIKPKKIKVDFLED